MQEMSKFTAKRYHTQAADYNPKQLKAVEVIKKCCGRSTIQLSWIFRL